MMTEEELNGMPLGSTVYEDGVHPWVRDGSGGWVHGEETSSLVWNSSKTMATRNCTEVPANKIETPSVVVKYALAYPDRDVASDPLIRNDLVALDAPSGGYPYRAKFMQQVKLWDTPQEAGEYSMLFHSVGFHLVQVTTEFVTLT